MVNLSLLKIVPSALVGTGLWARQVPRCTSALAPSLWDSRALALERTAVQAGVFHHAADSCPAALGLGSQLRDPSEAGPVVVASRERERERERVADIPGRWSGDLTVVRDLELHGDGS